MIQLGSKYSLAREKWIGRHYEGLKREYRDEWVAVLNSGVVDSDHELSRLVERLLSRYLEIITRLRPST